MKTVKFTKTATQLLYAKHIGEVIVSYSGKGIASTREAGALAFLRDNGFIKFLRQYSYNEWNKTATVVERHYEVLNKPEWMAK